MLALKLNGVLYLFIVGLVSGVIYPGCHFWGGVGYKVYNCNLRKTGKKRGEIEYNATIILVLNECRF